MRLAHRPASRGPRRTRGHCRCRRRRGRTPSGLRPARRRARGGVRPRSRRAGPRPRRSWAASGRARRGAVPSRAGRRRVRGRRSSRRSGRNASIPPLESMSVWVITIQRTGLPLRLLLDLGLQVLRVLLRPAGVDDEDAVPGVDERAVRVAEAAVPGEGVVLRHLERRARPSGEAAAPASRQRGGRRGARRGDARELRRRQRESSLGLRRPPGPRTITAKVHARSSRGPLAGAGAMVVASRRARGAPRETR